MPFIKIIRPFNCLFVAFTVLFGALISNNVIELSPIIFAVLSASFIAAAGYVINDFFDLPIDKVNKPNRILPSGKISPKTAYLFAVTLFFVGIMLSYLTTNFFCVGLAIINSIALFLYARYFKLSFLMGNLLVAYAAASTFIYGGLAANNLGNSLIIAIFAFLYTFLREIVKDAEDIEGDAEFGARTLAIKVGRKGIAWLSVIPILAIIFVSFYFFKNELISNRSFLLLQIFVSIPLILKLVIMIKQNTRKVFSILSQTMKINMVMLMIILWIG
ncbi:MAG: geranylgeranylglycerol-phosphate geranylgeranyltransferase [Candidatus Cloacimonetes bacterium]|nr:geranylgeranylglycerol-phosphate geranylgeranyltransferase [Candidatus Cloacimonadota bacterium]MCF7814506.1 geranylgeranylglycerol-phosphate geranylgeranyltransferase [Candidatus Cloacimonadota bacterium]MCF7869059.1 geranylgeranylglycerol-phosphate geranylgeranyltransferase [Candidatus Cloacimonadota bacterium]MCF7884454.1 geranylgeranylglycerol-phosphate geranylgeranyltransferase [Candidatus Cloacimonadota bacterium]